MLLFLGAGASKSFGLPLMNELTDLVVRELDDYPIKNIIQKIEEKVNAVGIEPDIEGILSCIDALSNPEISLKTAGPVAALVKESGGLNNYKFGKNEKYFEDISKKIRAIIRNNCHFPKREYIKKLEKTYNNFLNLFSIKPKNPLNVYTTNYDLCFERYCKKKGYRFYDCFDDDGKFDIEFTKQNTKSWEIYKLHGSSGWIVTDECSKGEFINSYLPIEHGEQTMTGEMIDDVMIYPTTEKYFSKSPYFELLNNLRNDLKRAKIGDRGPCIIIGYSFRDIPINNAFIDAFEHEESKQIAYIDLEGTNNVKNNIPELEHTIFSIDKPFDKNIGYHDFPYFMQQTMH